MTYLKIFSVPSSSDHPVDPPPFFNIYDLSRLYRSIHIQRWKGKYSEKEGISNTLKVVTTPSLNN